ncbi:MAG: hypothetical protein OHK0012_15680 [Synechococcales cyanobacterium]
MGQKPTRSLTLEEFLQLPETEPASEYIDEQSIQKPMPQRESSVIQTELAPGINQAVKPKQIARAFTTLRCTCGNRPIVPDISVFLWGKSPRQENGNGEVANGFLIAPV